MKFPCTGPPLWLNRPVPIEVNLSVMLAKRRMSLSELSERVGVSLQNLSVLKTGRGKAIRFSTLERLCEVLECQPGDLLAYDGRPFQEEEQS